MSFTNRGHKKLLMLHVEELSLILYVFRDQTVGLRRALEKRAKVSGSCITLPCFCLHHTRCLGLNSGFSLLLQWKSKRQTSNNIKHPHFTVIIDF